MASAFESSLNRGASPEATTHVTADVGPSQSPALSDTPPDPEDLDHFPAHVGIYLDPESTAGWPTPDLGGFLGLVLRNDGTASWAGWLHYGPQWIAPGPFDVATITVGIAAAVYAPTLGRTYVAAADLTLTARPGSAPNAAPADQRWDTSITDGPLSDYGALFPPRGNVATNWRFTKDVPASTLLDDLLAATPPVGQIIWVSSNPQLVHPLRPQG